MPIRLIRKQIAPTPVDMDLYDELILQAVVIANHAHYILYLSDSSLFLMKLIDKSEHLFYTEPRTGVGLHRPHRLVAKNSSRSCYLEWPSTLTCGSRESAAYSMRSERLSPSGSNCVITQGKAHVVGIEPFR
jgi:hypothetical protein